MRDDSARRVRWFPAVVIVVLLAFLAAGTASNLQRNPQPGLVAEGIPDRMPTATDDLLDQALADLDALTLPNGATLAGWDGPWRFVWPRDASFAAAAHCSVGQYAAAGKVLGFLDGVRPGSGRWEARYFADGSGHPEDGRAGQLDGSGWVLWTTWFCRGAGDLAKYWPMVKESGDQIVAELGPDGLPGPSPDYWERPESEVTLGTIAPLLTGLRSGIDIARTLGKSAEISSWQGALDRLSAATDREFGPDYPRTPADTVSNLETGIGGDIAGGRAGAGGDTARGRAGIGGDVAGGLIGIGGAADAIVTVLGPPFAPERPEVSAAIENAHDVLTQPNGGVTPNEEWRADGVAWTPQTALFALSAAARGDRATATTLLNWLDSHRTTSGAFPEKVNRNLHPAGEAPLGWTSALVVLTLTALKGPLPTP